MSYKGKGCFNAIFDGSIPIALVKHGLDTVFQKPSEPIEPIEPQYIADGLIANFCGLDAPVNNQWIDRVANIPATLYNSPIYKNKCYSFNGVNQYGDFNVDGAKGDFTMEVYYKQPTGSKGFSVMIGKSVGYYPGYGVQTYDGKLYSWFVKSIGSTVTNPSSANSRPSAIYDSNAYMSLRRSNTELTFNANSQNGNFQNAGTVASGTISSSIYSICKRGSDPTSDIISKGAYTQADVYAVRLYNRKLTDEEIAHNYKEDLRIYDNVVQSNFLLADGNILMTSDGNVFNTKEV
jgi:hypothetical protein